MEGNKKGNKEGKKGKIETCIGHFSYVGNLRKPLTCIQELKSLSLICCYLEYIISTLGAS